MNTKENNRLIAEFLGYNKEEVNGQIYFTHDDMIEALSDEELHYHSDWNALIEVVEKCREKQFFGSQSFISTINNRLYQLDLLATYSNVIEFIKYYNLKNI